MGNLPVFQSRLDQAKRKISEVGARESIILHHDEADGLASGALSKLAMEAMGLKAQLICIDKLYPQVVEGVEGIPGRVVVYSDIGSGHVDLLTEKNVAGNLVLALDHHDTSRSSDPMIINLNPELDGFSGEKEASSSTIAYMFAKTVSHELQRFIGLAVIGSLEIPGAPQGLNQIVEDEALRTHVAERKGTGDLNIEIGNSRLSRTKAATILNVLGSVGYYREGPRVGIEASIHGFEPRTVGIARELEEERKEANKRMLARIRDGELSQMKIVQWFHARDNYQGMSGKVVGSFCSYLRYQRGINPAKYLVGMMNVPQEIPGWGKLPEPLVKVSARAPQPLVHMIERGARPALSGILPEACKRVGGFGDGHSVAASGVFPIGREERFLEALDQLAVGDLKVARELEPNTS